MGASPTRIPAGGLLGLVLAALVATLGGCTRPQQSTQTEAVQPAPPPVEATPPAPPPPPTVAALLPLSGPQAAIGQDLLDAMHLALFSVPDNDLQILVRDTAGQPARAAEAARDAIDSGARLILGPLFARSARAVAPVAASRSVPVIAFSNDTTVARPGLFVLGFQPEEQVSRVVSYARAQGLEKIAALVPDDAYGRRAFEAWRKTLGEPLADALPAAVYAGDQNMIAQILRQFTDYDARKKALDEQKAELEQRQDEAAKAALAELATRDTYGPPPFDAVLIADGGVRLRSVLALLEYYDVDPALIRLLGTMRWLDDPEVLAQPIARGSWIAAPSRTLQKKFETRFQKTFGRRPHALATLGFDAAALAILVARGDPPFAIEQLTDPQGFDGYSGIFRLRRNGLVEHGLSILEIRDGGVVEVDPAPTRFPAGFSSLRSASPRVTEAARPPARTGRSSAPPFRTAQVRPAWR